MLGDLKGSFTFKCFIKFLLTGGETNIFVLTERLQSPSTLISCSPELGPLDCDWEILEHSLMRKMSPLMRFEPTPNGEQT